jgi:ribosome-associated toxin RatA of RatAB toxin-antitoxin module
MRSSITTPLRRPPQGAPTLLVSLVFAALLAPSGVAAGPVPRVLSPSEGAAAASPAEGHVPAATERPRIEAFAVRGSSLERVRGTVAVNAPIDRVRAVLFDFARYPQFMPHYSKAGVVRTTASGGRVVRMEIDQFVHLWMEIEIGPPRTATGIESYEGRLSEGNVKAFQPRWEIEALPGGRTRLSVESFLDPDLSLVPSSFVNSGARDGIRDAILALKARSEGRGSPR